MATNSFFYGATPSPEANTVDELIDSLEEKVAVAGQSNTDAITAAAQAAESAANARVSELAAADIVVTSNANVGAAAASAQTALDAATASSNSATNSANSATASATSATNSASSATAAATSATNASSSAVSASGSASTATTKAAEAATSATNSANSASSSASSASASATSATSAATQVTLAAAQVTLATTQATNSANSATASNSSANAASSSATAASSSASAASTSASNAATSATNSAASATQSANSATASSASAVTSGASATAAATSATNAATSATNAATSAASAAAIVTGVASNRASVRPSLLLDFALTKQLDPRITFTRASTATYYDGKTVAKAEENLLLQSQSFNSASWDRSSTTVSENSAAAPDLTTTANTVTTAAAGSSLRTNSVSVLPSTTYTLSFFALRGTMADLKYSIYNNTGASDIVSSTSYYSSTNSSTWSRVTVTFTTPVGCTSIFCFLLRDSIATGTVYLWGAQLEQRSSVTAYTPTTTTPITNYIPVLLTAASGAPRFEHNPITGESLGLEVEEQRTNLFLRSEDFSATWFNTQSSEQTNVIIAPDGTLTGDKLIENTATEFHALEQVLSSVAATSHTFSVYAKYAERNIQLWFGFNDVTGNPGANFDLQNGVVGATTGTITTSILPVGNGWYRCSVTVTSAVTTDFQCFIGLISSVSTSTRAQSYAGNGYAGAYIWGAQLEAGSFPTSYIPTVASQVTRSADAASMTGTNFSSWYRADEGTVYCETQTSSLAANRGTWAIGNPSLAFGSGNMMYEVYTSSASGQRSTNSYYNGVVQTGNLAPTSVSQAINTFSKSAFCYAINNFAMTVNAAAPGTDTSGLIAQGVTGLSIGDLSQGWQGSTIQLNGTIKRFAYYPKRLSNTELQGVTA